MNPKRHIIVLLLLAATAATAQDIVGLTLPTDLCAGQSRTISFGFKSQRNVRIYQPEVSLGHSDRIFLPDGVNCTGTGCSYKSFVDFTAFQPGATVTSVQDIEYVRLNIEHSYIGDLYINITCPNGQSADLMKKNHEGSNSSCASSIPNGSWGWHSGANTSGGTFLGNANDDEASGGGGGWPWGGGGSNVRCDSTAAGNEPGEGWNYCWSNNTTSGYQYAPGDAYIYRAANAHYLGGWGSYNRAIDSSNVAAGTNFYHPDDNFSALIGCPLNGQWYIEVMDGYSQDNGYVFEWELHLNANRVPPTTCEVTGYDIIGPYIASGGTDSTFVLTVPEGLQHDTAVAYRFVVHRTCGDTDTTAVIRLHPRYNLQGDTVVCDLFRIGTATYTSSTTIQANGRTVHQCDSNLSLRLTVLHSSDTTIRAEVVENELPYLVGGIALDHPVADTTLHLANAEGCDSTIRFSLVVHPNHDTWLDTTVCQSGAPFTWHGHTFSHSETLAFTLTDSQGADSTVHLKATVIPETDTLIELSLPESALPFNFMHIGFTASTDTLIIATNRAGCDSLVHLRLTVLPSRLSVEERHICDVDTPFVWNGYSLDTSAVLSLDLTAADGADSVAELRLSVHPTFDTTLADTTCDNIGLRFGNTLLVRSGHYVHTYTTAAGCDSTVSLHLTVYPHSEEYFTDTICRGQASLFEDSLYRTAGRHLVRYATADGCDSLRVLDLAMRDLDFEARLKASNLIATLQDPVVHLFNISLHAASHYWLIMGDTLRENNIRYVYPTEEDSVLVSLVAYGLQQCTDTARATLTIDRSALSTPNVFTPTQDENNTWAPALRDITALEIWIYNRQGNLVAHWDTPSSHWDGTAPDGTACPQGAYVWRLNYSTRVRPEQVHTLVGTVTLIR